MTYFFADQPVTWSTTVNTWGVFALAAMQAIGMWWSDRHRKQNHHDISMVRTDISDVQTEIKSVKRSVDGPMGQALQTAASALAIAAKARPEDSDLILRAIAAQKESDAHKHNMLAVEEEARKDMMSKAKIIAEWKAAQNPPIP